MADDSLAKGVIRVEVDKDHLNKSLRDAEKAAAESGRRMEAALKLSPRGPIAPGRRGPSFTPRVPSPGRGIAPGRPVVPPSISNPSVPRSPGRSPTVNPVLPVKPSVPQPGRGSDGRFLPKVTPVLPVAPGGRGRDSGGRFLPSGPAVANPPLPASIKLPRLGGLGAGLKGAAAEASVFGKAISQTAANVVQRFPAAQKQVDKLRDAIDKGTRKAQAFARLGRMKATAAVRPVQERATALGSAIKGRVGQAANDLRDAAGMASTAAGKALAEKFEPAIRKAKQFGTTLRGMSIQSQRFGRALGKDFAPLTQAFSRIRARMPKLPSMGGVGAGIGKAGAAFAGAIPTKQIAGIGRAIASVGATGVRVGATLTKAGASIAKGFLGGAFKASLTAGQRALRGLGSAVTAVGRGIKGLIATTVAAAAPLVAIGAVLAGGLSVAASVKTFANFEQAMARVKAVSGATADEFRNLEARAEELGRTTQFSASQAAEAMGNFAQAGFSVNEIMQAIGPSLDLAAAGQLDMATASDITAKVMRGMQIDASELGNVMDVLAKAFTTSNTDLVQLGEAMKFVGPVAASAGKDLNEVVASLQVLSDAGLQASLAGTGLKGILSRLAQNGPEVKKVFDSLGVKSKEASGALRPMSAIVEDFNKAIKAQGKEAQVTALAMNAFGERAGPAFAVLLGKGGAALREYEKRLANSGGTAKKIADVQRKTLKGAFTQLFSAIEGVAINFGRALAPAVGTIVKAFTDITPAIGNVLVKIKPLSDAMGTALAGRLTAIGAFLQRNGDEFQKWFRSISEVFNNVSNLAGQAFDAVGKFAAGLMGLKGGFGGIGDAAASQISKVLDAISTATFDPIELSKAIPQVMAGGAKIAAATILDAIRVGVGTLAQTITTAFNAAVAGLAKVLEAFVTGVPLAIAGGIKTGLPSVLGGDAEAGAKMQAEAGSKMMQGIIDAQQAAYESAARDFTASTRTQAKTEAVPEDQRNERVNDLRGQLMSKLKHDFIPRNVFDAALAELNAAYDSGADMPTVTNAEAQHNRAQSPNVVAGFMDDMLKPISEGLREGAAENFDTAGGIVAGVEAGKREEQYTTRRKEVTDRMQSGELPKDVWKGAIDELHRTWLDGGDLRGDRTETEKKHFKDKETFAGFGITGKLSGFGAAIGKLATGASATLTGTAADLGKGDLTGIVGNIAGAVSQVFKVPGEAVKSRKIEGGQLEDTMGALASLQEGILKSDPAVVAAENTASNTSEGGPLHAAIKGVEEALKRIKLGFSGTVDRVACPLNWMLK